MKPVLRNILLGGLTLGLGKAIYEKGKQDERKEIKNSLNEVLADWKIEDIKEKKENKMKKLKRKLIKSLNKRLLFFFRDKSIPFNERREYYDHFRNYYNCIIN